jgi:hypothetical protein
MVSCYLNLFFKRSNLEVRVQRSIDHGVILRKWTIKYSTRIEIFSNPLEQIRTYVQLALEKILVKKALYKIDAGIISKKV